MKIITIGREFGSGGRELGKRLADALGVPCYDKEIIAEVAKLQGVSPEYVERITQTDIVKVYAGTIGRSTYAFAYNQTAVNVMTAQREVLKKLATEDCVIVGRQADIILQDLEPLNLFVYADKESKVRRCLARASEGESEKDIVKQMKRIDKDRAATRRMIGGGEWGDRENYHLCVNTSGKEIKTLIPALVAYVNAWFE